MKNVIENMVGRVDDEVHDLRVPDGAEDVTIEILKIHEDDIVVNQGKSKMIVTMQSLVGWEPRGES